MSCFNSQKGVRPRPSLGNSEKLVLPALSWSPSFYFLVLKVPNFLPNLEICELSWTNVTETRRQDRNLGGFFFFSFFPLPLFLSSYANTIPQVKQIVTANMLSPECNEAHLSVSGPCTFVKVKQGHISKMHFWTQKMPVFPVAKGVPFQWLEKITGAAENTGVLFKTGLWNGTFL